MSEPLYRPPFCNAKQAAEFLGVTVHQLRSFHRDDVLIPLRKNLYAYSDLESVETNLKILAQKKRREKNLDIAMHYDMEKTNDSPQTECVPNPNESVAMLWQTSDYPKSKTILRIDQKRSRRGGTRQF